MQEPVMIPLVLAEKLLAIIHDTFYASLGTESINTAHDYLTYVRAAGRDLKVCINRTKCDNEDRK